MRPIAQWVDQTVAYVGVVSQWKRLENGQYQILMVNVQVRPYPSDVEAVHIDHLWFYTDYLPSHTQRLVEFVGLGTVFPYTRSNGSRDYAIRWNSWIALQEEVDALVIRHTFQQVGPEYLLEHLDLLIEAHQTNRALVRFESSLAEYKAALDLMQAVRVSLVQKIEGIRASQAVAQRQFRGTVKPDPIRFPVNPRLRDRVGGFAPCR